MSTKARSSQRDSLGECGRTSFDPSWTLTRHSWPNNLACDRPRKRGIAPYRQHRQACDVLTSGLPSARGTSIVTGIIELPELQLLTGAGATTTSERLRPQTGAAIGDGPVAQTRCEMLACRPPRSEDASVNGARREIDIAATSVAIRTKITDAAETGFERIVLEPALTVGQWLSPETVDATMARSSSVPPAVAVILLPRKPETLLAKTTTCWPPSTQETCTVRCKRRRASRLRRLVC